MKSKCLPTVSGHGYRENKSLGLEKMKQAGAQITAIEIALFELQRVARGEAFKEISRLVK